MTEATPERAPASVEKPTTTSASATTGEAATAEVLHRRERAAYGGSIQWEAAFFGWLAAVGLAAMLIAMVVGAGLAVGFTELRSTAAEPTQTLSVGGGVIVVLVLGIAYLAGGYVAGRMARFDGARQGLGVWLLAVLAAVALGLAAWIGGAEYNVFSTLDLPRIPVDEGSLSSGGAIALGAAVVVTLLSAVAGGIAGERFHRAVDRAGVEPEASGPAEASE